jgi:hypothetical protein
MELARKFRLSKKGFMFVLDALLASMILVGGLLLISQHLLTERSNENLEYLTTDMLSVLYELKMSDIEVINSSFYSYLSGGSSYTNRNLSIMEQIGTYWAINQSTLAANLSNFVMNNLFPKNMGFNMSMNVTVVFNQSLAYENYSSLIAGQRMITGIKGNVSSLEGSTSSAYLQRIYDKRTSSFAYFGGFVGQGNITIKLERIPDDVVPADIMRILIELDAVTNFSVIINGDFCTTLNASNTTMTPERWDITFCNSSIASGINNITLDFQGNLNDAYVMGGNIRVEYKTDELQQSISLSNKTYLFPEIKGVVNLFDSFYIPGNLTEMTIYLHYLANHSILALNNTFYLTLGKTAVLVDIDSTTEQSITLNNALLQSMLNYSNIGGKTIPIRMGFENLTYDSEYVGNSQVMLVTDTSGTMNEEMIGTDTGVKRNCDNASFNNSDTQRLSVAKCLDKQFAADVLNISGNILGLVSYDTTTNADTLAPTTNLTRINNVIGTANPETGYRTGLYTCICCGINSARDELIRGAVRTVLIANKTNWKYNTNSFSGEPSNDSNGNSWYEFDYDDASWLSGDAVLGHYLGGAVPVITDLGAGSLGSSFEYANLWENVGDTAGPPNDFTSGILNSTGNTFNISGANDGWDWAGGVYGYDSAAQFNGASGQHLNMSFGTGSPAQNRCHDNRCSGAYGISVNITDEMMAYLANGGSATLSFYYEWRPNSNSFETSDEAWIKARWTLPNLSSYYLGWSKDAGHEHGDSGLEIDAADNPNQQLSGNVSIDLTDMITSSGTHYLDMGGKLRADNSDEWGYVYFDNIQLLFTNKTDRYYFRRHFTLSDTNISVARRALINLLSDDYAKIYVNGNIVFDNQNTLNGTYWDRRGIFVDGSNFKVGDNVVAVELVNSAGSAKFDMELIGINSSQQGAMLIMTDGQANEDCPTEQHTHSAIQDAIQAACDARQKWGIQVFAVGYSTSADESTLEGMATCGEGIYAKSDNTSALSDFYNQVVLNIIAATVKSQTVIVSGGNLSESNLYGDSYIFYKYTPIIEPPQPNEISVEIQSSQFNNCSATVTLPSGIRIADAKVTSYSGEHWTRTLSINSNPVYNLSEYNTNFTTLGDPYLIHAPPSLFINGSNVFYVDTGDDSVNSTGCSKNNSLIYTALVPSSTERSPVVQNTIGCNWTIQFEDDTFSNKIIPVGCSGISPCPRCSYIATNHTLENNSYDPTDAYDIAVFNLLKKLDFDDNGKIFVNLDAIDIEIIITTITSVPYLWGPTLVRARVWQ